MMQEIYDPTIDDVIAYKQLLTKKTPDFKGENEPAIAAYEQAIGLPLPPLYHGYLHHMGQYDSGILSNREFRSRLALLQEFWIEEIQSGHDQIAPGYILIGLGTAAVEQIWLNTKPPYAIYEGSGGQLLTRYTDGLAKFLFRNIYMQDRHGQFTHSQVYTTYPMTDIIPRVFKLLADLSLQPLWFSDGICVCAENSDISLIVHQLQPLAGKEGIFSRISSNSLTAIDHMVVQIEKYLGIDLREGK